MSRTEPISQEEFKHFIIRKSISNFIMKYEVLAYIKHCEEIKEIIKHGNNRRERI